MVWFDSQGISRHERHEVRKLEPEEEMPEE